NTSHDRRKANRPSALPVLAPETGSEADSSSQSSAGTPPPTAAWSACATATPEECAASLYPATPNTYPLLQARSPGFDFLSVCVAPSGCWQTNGIWSTSGRTP